MPVDFGGGSENDLLRRAISVPGLLDEIEKAHPKLALLILDACRDNPFNVVSRTVQKRGLGELAKPVPDGVLIIYSASSNQSALDSVPGQSSKNSLFTSEFLGAVKEPNLEIRDLARRVRFSVMDKAKAAGYAQVPALYDNLSQGAFFFSTAQISFPVAAPPAIPSKIRLIVPAAQGGPTDVLIRAIAPHLGSALNAELTVENQIDILGDTVAQMVASSAQDGSVVLVSNFNQALRRHNSGAQQLQPIGMVADVALAVAVNANVPADSISSMVSVAKSRGRPLNMGAGSTGSVDDMCARQMQRKLGDDIINVVNTRGSAPSLFALLGGEFDLVCGPAVLLRPHAKAGKVRVIGEIRSSAKGAGGGDVPSVAMQGFDVVAPNWLGLYGPRGLRSDLVDKLSAALRTSLASAEVSAKLRQFGAVAASSDEASPRGLDSSVQLGASLQAR